MSTGELHERVYAPFTPASVTVAAVLLLPLTLLIITVMVLAIASLVVPSRRQRHLLAVLDRLMQIVLALRGSGR